MKKLVVLGMLAGGAVTFAVMGTGCKKEETKVEAPAQGGAKEAAPSGEVFKAEVAAGTVPQKVKSGATFELPVKVKNTSSATWASQGPNSVRLSYHWRDAKTNKAIIWDGTRTMFAKDIAPGQEALVIAKVEAPAQSGLTVLELDLVQEKIGWFSKKGWTPSRYKIEVK